MGGAKMKKGQQDKSKEQLLGPLDLYFAKMAAQTNKNENDDCVQVVREIRSKADKDPNWTVSNGISSSSSVLNVSSNYKPKRLIHVLRRKNLQTEQSKSPCSVMVTDDVVNGAKQDNMVGKAGEQTGKSLDIAQGSNRSELDFNRSYESDINQNLQNVLYLPDINSTKSSEAVTQRERVFTHASRKNNNWSALRLQTKLADTSLCSSASAQPPLLGQDALDETSDDITASSSASSIKPSSGPSDDACKRPCFSLRVLDSQEYFSENEEKNESEVDGEESSLSQVMEIDVNVLEAQLPPHDVVSHNSMTATCVASLPKATKNARSNNDEVIVLSDSSSVESEQDVFHPRRTAEKRSATIATQTPPRCRRQKISKQLFPVDQRSLDKPRRKSLKKPVQVSPAKIPKLSPRYKGKGRGPKSAQKRSEMDQKICFKGNSSNTNSNTNENIKEEKRGSLEGKDICIKSEPRSSLAGDSSSRPITPDNDLEEIMKSLDDTNTYSPTKLSQANKASTSAHQDNRPITPDDDLECVMLKLNDSNTYSPNKQRQHRIPYYLANVRTAIDAVMMCPIDVQYMDVDDVLAMELFSKSISEQAQLLYLRMLFRNYDWIPKSKLKYEEIPDLSEALQDLVDKQLLQDNQQELPLKQLLGMMSVPLLKKVCKDMKLNDKLKGPRLIQSMLQHAAQRNAASMLNRAVSTEQAMIKRIRDVLPPCYKLTQSHRSVFMRVFMLYGLVFDMHSGSREQTQSQLMYMMLREAVGQIEFPKVPLNRVSKIFMDREYVLRRQEGHDIEEVLDNLQRKKDFEAGLPWVEKCKQYFWCWIKEQALVQFDKLLPSHLRRYTCTSQIIRCLGIAADLLQKLKLWQQAADIYHMVLGQRVYSVSKRGFWYERLSLIYHSHIKDPAKAAEVVVEALQDSHVRVGHRLSIYQRGRRLQQSKAQKTLIGDRLDTIEHAEIQPCPETVICGVGRSGGIPDTDRVNVFLHTDTRGRITTRSVENVAMDHYMSKYELDKGLHRESSVYTTMYGLLFWDIIYKPGVPDTFFNCYQYQPLDFQTDEFYLKRKEDIDQRLSELRSATPEALRSLVEPVWCGHKDQCSICVIWDVFDSVDDCLDLMLCIGTPLLADICERLAKNYRFCRSGMPDLTMWNGKSGKYKIVEVKGPNDKLSTKQILWNDYLVKHGADAEVCYVKIDSSKRPSKE